MKVAWCMVALLLAGSVRAALPPGVTVREVEAGVTRYERPAAPRQVPSFWNAFFDLFKLKGSTKLPFSRSVAVLVGVANYRYLTPKLTHTARDVEKMRDYLLGEGGFDVVLVMDERATPELLRKYMMDRVNTLVGPEDRLLFYFSGHGARVTGGSGGGAHPYLQFRDAKPEEWSHDVLLVDEYRVWSNQCQAKHMLFIFDSCFAGDAVAKDGYREAVVSVAQLSANGSRTLVTAASANQRAWMLKRSSAVGYSVFTDELIKALREGTADKGNRGFVTIKQAVAEAEVQLAAIAANLGQEMKPEVVSIPSTRTGTFVFLNTKAEKPDVPESDRTIMGLEAKDARPDPKGDVELAFWKSVEPMNDPALLEQVCVRFPKGNFCDVARKKIALLKSTSGVEVTGKGGIGPPPPDPQPVKLMEGMVRIDTTPPASRPGVTFWMGHGESNEESIHDVLLSPYDIDRTEVTLEQYQQCVEQGRCTATSTGDLCNWDREGRDNHPVNCVTWEQADQYCKTVGKRLPTEAEWEFAARGKDQRTYPWASGTRPGGQVCWDGEGNALGRGHRWTTCPVGAYPAGATPEGIQDMAGNVQEWVSDWYGAYPSGRVENPTGPSAGTARVIRGGSWGIDDPSFVRGAVRGRVEPGRSYGVVGFRCARGVKTP